MLILDHAFLRFLPSKSFMLTRLQTFFGPCVNWAGFRYGGRNFLKKNSLKNGQKRIHYPDTILTGLIFNLLFRIQIADPEYKKAFDDELVAFKERIQRRAKEKIAEQLKEEQEEEEREKEERIKSSPGGLDPIEVLESLPADLRRYAC